jgi:hypothetical protein
LEPERSGSVLDPDPVLCVPITGVDLGRPHEVRNVSRRIAQPVVL